MIIEQILCALNLSDVAEQICTVTMFAIVDVKSEYLTYFVDIPIICRRTNFVCLAQLIYYSYRHRSESEKSFRTVAILLVYILNSEVGTLGGVVG
jgi:hypothetical protein